MNSSTPRTYPLTHCQILRLFLYLIFLFFIWIYTKFIRLYHYITSNLNTNDTIMFCFNFYNIIIIQLIMFLNCFPHHIRKIITMSYFHSLYFSTTYTTVVLDVKMFSLLWSLNISYVYCFPIKAR